MNDQPYRKPQWVNITFFIITISVSLIGIPLYLFNHGLVLSDIILFLFYFVVTGMSITVGYHRLFAHHTYKAHPVAQWLLLFFGAAAFEQSALKWSSQHRNHHLYTDTDLDPYSVNKGFWHAHMDWLISWERPQNYSNVMDLQKSPMIMHQHRYFVLWSGVAGVIIPTLIGALCGSAWGAFIIAVCFRIVAVQQVTFCINSLCHMLGKATYDPKSSAKDHWFVALLTFGEGYHNFHHRFPGDYRNGIRWYHFDPSKWVIAFMGLTGLAWDLKKVSYFRIVHARMNGQNQLVKEYFAGNAALNAEIERIKIIFDKQYLRLQENLRLFEVAAEEYQRLIRGHIADQSSALREIKMAALEKVRQRREAFQHTQQRWENWIEAHLPVAA